jgi:hypothetical protein
MSKKLATTVYITEQQQALLKELNLRSRVPVAEFIRQGIDLVIHRYQDLLPGQMDLPLGGQPPENNIEILSSLSSRE